MEHQTTEVPPQSERGLGWRRAAVILGSTLVIVALVSAFMLIVLPSEPDGDLGLDAIRLTITVGIPVLLVVGYWIVAREQVRRATRRPDLGLGSDEEVIARVSHRLRDRLTVVYGFSETLLDSDLTDTMETRDLLTVINTEAIDLGRIVDDLVTTTEIESGTFDLSSSRFDPATEIERVVVPFRRRGHEISIDCWSGVAVSDAIRFRQVVRSLISNAVLHGGSEIAVVGALVPGEFRCTIADDGPGLDSDVEARIFRHSPAASQALLDTSGTGLGLSVAVAIADRLGGRVGYERSDEDITMVTLSLPTADWPDAFVSVPDPSEDVDDDDPGAGVVTEDAPEPDPGIERRSTEHRIAFEADEPAIDDGLPATDGVGDRVPDDEVESAAQLRAGST